MEPSLELVFNAAALPVLAFFLWWRLDRIEERLRRIEERIESLAAADKLLGERVARLEGRLNGMRDVR